MKSHSYTRHIQYTFQRSGLINFGNLFCSSVFFFEILLFLVGFYRTIIYTSRSSCYFYCCFFGVFFSSFYCGCEAPNKRNHSTLPIECERASLVLHIILFVQLFYFLDFYFHGIKYQPLILD
jgi:hypothetical protein